MNLKTGDILICKGHSVISKTIMAVTKSEWSHAALYLEIDGKSYIIEAQKNGVNLKPYDVWVDKWKYEFIVYRYIHRFDDAELISKALSKSGETSYDFESFILKQPWKILTGKWRSEKREDKRMICSEFVAWVYLLPNWWKLTPDELDTYLKSSNGWVTISQSPTI